MENAVDQAPNRPTDDVWDFRFSTDNAPSGEKFDAWRDASLRLVGVEASSDDPQSFEGEFVGRTAGPVTLVRSTTGISHYERTRSLADESDELSLSFFGGDHRVSTPERELGLAIGDGLFLSLDRPFGLTQLEDADTSYHLLIERTSLLDLLPRRVDLSARCFVANGATLGLIRSYIPALTSVAEPPSLEVREMMGRHMLDLIALLLRPSPAAIEVIEDRGLKAARIKAILDLIARHHTRQDLSPPWVGLKLGISPRQVHRLLEETPKTFNEHLLEARLNHAFELLSDPYGPAVSIAEIGIRCGFAGLSHFSRAFRVRFGDTPTGVRAKAAREAAAASLPPLRVAA